MTPRELLLGALLTFALALPASAQDQKCDLNRFSLLPITTIPDGRFTVPVVLNGHTLDFEVDTGGVVATIDRAQAFNLHLSPRYAPGGLKGVAGNSLNFIAVLKTFSLGRLEGTDLAAYLDDRLSPGVDGTLSPDMMRHYDVDIDLLRGTLSLFSQNHCAGKVVYWTKSGYVVLPIDVESDGHIRVPVTVDGVEVKAFLDTGAQHSLISMGIAKKIGISENSPDLKLAISHCETIKDFISRELFTHILESEEEHIDWLQTQMRLIEQMGIENYVQLQTKPNESSTS